MAADSEEWRWWLALARVSGVGPVTYRALIETVGAPHAIFSTSIATVAGVPGCGRKIAAAIQRFSGWDEVDAEVARLAALGADLLTWNDPRYPVHLRTIHDPPPFLYLLGDLAPDQRRVVAIVGSRRATPYGVAVARRIAADLARAGFVIVSGMARGIDSAAHDGALSVGGSTVAVLGCGVDVVYPPESRSLKSTIQTHGAVVSELPLGSAPDPHHFPARNRIISGVAMGVLVVEASAESGSLITARLASEQGREVFAVPGNVGSSTSHGTNRLIKAGATLVETAEDLIEELVGPLGEARIQPPITDPVASLRLTAEEAKLFDALTLEPSHVDEITARTRMAPEQVVSLLLGLELKGVARQIAGHRYVRDHGVG